MPNLTSLLLPPDPDFVASGIASSASSSYDRQAGRGISSSTNEGALVLFATGNPTTDAASIETRVQTSGGIGAGSTWAWRYKGEGDEGWRGSDDARFQHSISDPFGGSEYGNGVSAVYVSRLRREIVYRTGSGSVHAAYREVDRVEVGWTTTTISFPRGIDNTNDSSCGFDVVELPDGSLRAVVRYDSDLDVYGSEDGISWTMLADNVLSRFAGRRSSVLLGLKIAESGGYLRIVVVDYDVDTAGLLYTVTTLVSSDRGATWIETNRVSDGDYIDANYATSWSTGLGRFVLDVVGAGDGGGSFLLAIKYGQYVRVYTASGTEGFSLTDTASSTSSGALTVYMGAATTFRRVFLGRGPDFVHLLVLAESYYYGSGNVVLTHFRLDRRASLASGSWDPYSSIDALATGWYGTMRYIPHRAKLHHIGHSLVLVGSIYDLDGAADEVGVSYWREEGWSLRPLRDAHPPDVYSAYAVSTFALQPYGPLFDVIEWTTSIGRPGGSTWASSVSPWTRVYSGGITCNWTTDRLRLTDATGAGARGHYYEYVDPSTSSGALPDASWCIGESTVSGPDGSLIEWTVKVSGGFRAQTAANMVDIESLPRSGSTSGRAVHLQVRFDGTGIRIYDVGTSSTLAEILPSTATYGATPMASGYWECRLAFQPEPPSTVCACVLSIRRIDKEEWLSTARLFPSTSASSIVRQRVRFGVVSSAASGYPTTSYWRDLRIKQGNALGQVDLSGAFPSTPGRIRPDTVRGRPLSTFPVYVAEGLDASWGGGGGFDGDTHSSTLSQQFGIVNTVLSSPRFEWRSAKQATASTSLSSSTLTYSNKRGTAGRFRHDALAIFGTNAVSVQAQYSNDPTFASYTTAGTLYLTRFSGLRVDAVSGNRISISGTLPSDAEVGSALGRTYYARITEGLPGGYSDAREWVIEQHRGSSLLLRTSSALTSALVGASLAIRSDRGVLLYDQAAEGAYLRLLVSNTHPAEGYQRIGTPIPSVRVGFPAALSWDHDDASSENVTAFRSRGGVAWGYTEGPSRRSLSVSIDGEADRQRQRIRDVLRTTAGYSEFASVLVLDDGNLLDPESVVLGRVSGGIDLSNPGWKLEGSVWRPVGSLRLRLDEEV